MILRAKGTLTVFFALIFLSLAVLFGTLFDGISAFETKKMITEYEYLSLENELAGYVRELWDDYHLLFMYEDFRDEDKVSNSLPGGFTDYTVENGDITPERYFKEDGVFSGQIADYMKYAAIPELIELLGNNEKQLNENEKTDENLKKRLKAEEHCDQTVDYKSAVSERAEELYKTHTDFMDSTEFSEDDADNKALIYSHVSDMLKQNEKAKKDIGKYETSYEESLALMKEYEANAESDEDYDKLKSLMNNGKSEIDGTKATLLSNEAKLTRIKEMCNDEQVSSGTLISMLDSVSYSGGAGNNGAGNKKVKNEYKEKLGNLLSKGVLTLVLPEGSTPSKKKIKEKNSLDIKHVKGEGNKILTSVYLYKHFGNYLKENEKESALSYELEYIVCGKKSDEDNLAGVAEMLLGIRTGANILKIYKDPARVAKAGELALAIAGPTGNAAAVFAVKSAIITYWATVDAISELKELYSGKTVDGLTYEKYLMTLIVAKSNDKLLSRSAFLMESNIKERYKNDFSLEKLYSKVSRKAKITIRGTFTPGISYEGSFSRSY